MKCYARALGGCAGGQSREHFVSAAILQLLNRDNGLILSGFSKLNGGQEISLPPAALASNILCKAHNERLSPIDSNALAAFTTIMDATDYRRIAALPDRTVVSGLELERWMLKMMAGLAISGHLGTTIESVPNLWLRIIFGLAKHGRRTGVFFADEVNLRRPRQAGVKVAPWLNRSGAMRGLVITLCGLRFIYSLEPYSRKQRASDPVSMAVLHRPRRFNFVYAALTCHRNMKSLVFAWDRSIASIPTSRVGGTTFDFEIGESILIG